MVDITINFGNGLKATTGRTTTTIPFGITDHEGAVYPDLDVPLWENGVRDGGTVGTTRAQMRRMRFNIHHDGTTKRAALMQAFSPNVERTATVSLGFANAYTPLIPVTAAMPYYVESMTFPQNLVRAQRDFSVTLVSRLAYPECQITGNMQALPASTGGLEYPYSYPINYDTLTAYTSETVTNYGQVPSPAVVAAILAVSAADIQITTPAGVTTITGTLSAGDVVIIDAENHTVAVNGTNRLSWFDRTGVWPRIDPGVNTLSSNRLGTFGITWKPRIFGLLAGEESPTLPGGTGA